MTLPFSIAVVYINVRNYSPLHWPFVIEKKKKWVEMPLGRRISLDINGRAVLSSVQSIRTTSTSGKSVKHTGTWVHIYITCATSIRYMSVCELKKFIKWLWQDKCVLLPGFTSLKGVTSILGAGILIPTMPCIYLHTCIHLFIHISNTKTLEHITIGW